MCPNYLKMVSQGGIGTRCPNYLKSVCFRKVPRARWKFSRRANFETARELDFQALFSQGSAMLNGINSLTCGVKRY